MEDITNHNELQSRLYDNAVGFYKEHMVYRSFNVLNNVRSNQIKKFLHQILTHAIFHYSPCKDLLKGYDENHKPLEEKWATNVNLWESLSADPFPCVSNLFH